MSGLPLITPASRRPDVKEWLDANGIRLGSSEDQVTHWLVIDGQRLFESGFEQW